MTPSSGRAEIMNAGCRLQLWSSPESKRSPLILWIIYWAKQLLMSDLPARQRSPTTQRWLGLYYNCIANLISYSEQWYLAIATTLLKTQKQQQQQQQKQQHRSKTCQISQFVQKVKNLGSGRTTTHSVQCNVSSLYHQEATSHLPGVAP